MSEIIIYHNGRCSKSRGALEILQEKGVPHEVRYYLMEPLSKAELKRLLKKLGMKAEEIVRKSETLYKEEYKDKKLTNEEWIAVLAEHPILIERPIVENGDKAVVARPPEKVLEIL
ncbi:arsenate reductase (glutaredoxin) [Taibaiella soli]|uniref:Arsenate reductase (Glutaredoxin) n=1 Tax=Taibaiella soli TaxID=1649169 RepID=A0A2W2BAA0_9BACT|nr:arsenate reductase (glutaredoxin) [Taibaiella soli]PZF73169.1 arsenate reductase (glutaredoxin) [Taibaiella soli]